MDGLGDIVGKKVEEHLQGRLDPGGGGCSG